MSPQVDLEVRWSPERHGWIVKHRSPYSDPDSTDWSVKVFDVLATKREALTSAAKLANVLRRGNDTRACEVYVYRRFGQRSRWVDRRTYGRDPRRSEG